MAEASENPYEAPSVAASCEAARGAALLDSREQRGVRAFLAINRLAAGVFLVSGGMLALGLVGAATKLPLREWPSFLAVTIPIAATLLTWGTLLAHRNWMAIVATGLVSGGMSLLLLLGLLMAVFTPNSPFGGPEAIVATLFALLLSGAIFGPPVWAAAQAVRWRCRGIDLTRLDLIHFGSAKRL